MSLENPKITESPESIARYEAIKELGQDIFKNGETGKADLVTQKDVYLAKEFLAKSAEETNPPVWASYWEHVILAPELGRRVSKESADNGIAVNPDEVEFLLWLHDVGVEVTPRYLRKDFIGDQILIKAGIPREILEGLSSTHRLMVEAEKLQLTDSQIRLEEELDVEQKRKVDYYFDSLSPTQRITNLADNLGKRDEDGLFTLEAFRKYLKTQETRYSKSSPWSTENWSIASPTEGKPSRRPAGAVLQYFTVAKTVEWLEEMGVDFNGICRDLSDYGPRFVTVVRHGELDNPKGIVYNRDNLMDPNDIIHLSIQGKDQMRQVAKTLSDRRFNSVGIFSSPETRAIESAETLRENLQSAVIEIKTLDGLDDSLSPGPYIEGMKMGEFMKLGGNVYDSSRWGKYDHESSESIVSRTQNIFWRAARSLKAGENAILVSHGDPIAWLLNSLEGSEISPDKLRDMIYPKKGEAVVAIIDPKGELFTMYSLNGPRLTSSKIY